MMGYRRAALIGRRRQVLLLQGVLLLLFLFSCQCVDMSGFYYDNGKGQTVLQSRLDPREQEVMQEEILHLLGLNYRPHSSSSGSNKRRANPSSNSTVPTFMKDIYRSLLNEVGDDGEIKNLTFQNLDVLHDSQFHLEDKDLQAINESDIIMSFVNYGHQEEFEFTRRFWFDVSEVGLADDVLSSELRIYKEARDGDSAFKVSVYQLVDGTTGEDDRLDSVTVSQSQEGWIILETSKALRFWQAFPKHNLGLLLKVASVTGQTEASPHDIGLIGDRETHTPHESFMVAFLKNSRSSELSLSRERRSPAPEDEKKAKKPTQSPKRRQKQYSFLEQDFATDNVYNRDYYGGRYKRRGCQKRTLFVSFRDLGWQDWIIAPDGYAAFYCHGECSFPLNTHMNATNHAIVQTLVHLMTPFNVPKPCCAPTKLSGISVLYFDESSNVILKKYKNMVVKSCGCH